MSLVDLIPDSIAIRFTPFLSIQEFDLKFSLDMSYNLLKLENIDWEVYNKFLNSAHNRLQKYDGRFKNYFENYYQKIKTKEALKR